MRGQGKKRHSRGGNQYWIAIELTTYRTAYDGRDQALMDILAGKSEPSALLTFQMPVAMKTVEIQFEDVPRDMKADLDSEANTYDFGYGLNSKGVISDERTGNYRD